MFGVGAVCPAGGGADGREQSVLAEAVGLPAAVADRTDGLCTGPGTPAALVCPRGRRPGVVCQDRMPPRRAACASKGTRVWAFGLPQPVTGSQPGPAW
jgi:hypothetical protein